MRSRNAAKTSRRSAGGYEWLWRRGTVQRQTGRHALTMISMLQLGDAVRRRPASRPLASHPELATSEALSTDRLARVPDGFEDRRCRWILVRSVLASPWLRSPPTSWRRRSACRREALMIVAGDASPREEFWASRRPSVAGAAWSRHLEEASSPMSRTHVARGFCTDRTRGSGSLVPHPRLPDAPASRRGVSPPARRSRRTTPRPRRLRLATGEHHLTVAAATTSPHDYGCRPTGSSFRSLLCSRAFPGRVRRVALRSDGGRPALSTFCARRSRGREAHPTFPPPFFAQQQGRTASTRSTTSPSGAAAPRWRSPGA
jgi:hypothetical protein